MGGDRGSASSPDLGLERTGGGRHPCHDLQERGDLVLRAFELQSLPQ